MTTSCKRSTGTVCTNWLNFVPFQKLATSAREVVTKIHLCFLNLRQDLQKDCLQQTVQYHCIPTQEEFAWVIWWAAKTLPKTLLLTNEPNRRSNHSPELSDGWTYRPKTKCPSPSNHSIWGNKKRWSHNVHSLFLVGKRSIISIAWITQKIKF